MTDLQKAVLSLMVGERTARELLPSVKHLIPVARAATAARNLMRGDANYWTKKIGRQSVHMPSNGNKLIHRGRMRIVLNTLQSLCERKLVRRVRAGVYASLPESAMGKIVRVTVAGTSVSFSEQQVRELLDAYDKLREENLMLRKLVTRQIRSSITKQVVERVWSHNGLSRSNLIRMIDVSAAQSASRARKKNGTQRNRTGHAIYSKGQIVAGGKRLVINDAIRSAIRGGFIRQQGDLFFSGVNDETDHRADLPEPRSGSRRRLAVR